MAESSWSSDILAQFDNCAEEYDFPILDNAYLKNAGIRLTALRSSNEWLIIFEEIAYTTHNDFVNAISIYGNKIEKSGSFQLINIIDYNDDFYLSNGLLNINPFKFDIIIYGDLRSYEISKEDYERAGLKIEEFIAPIDLLRVLVYVDRNNCFLKEKNLKSICKCKHLDVFIKLDEWHHPDLTDDELPSENDCFISLSKAIASNDPSLYSCHHEHNTHWSNWE